MGPIALMLKWRSLFLIQVNNIMEKSQAEIVINRLKGEIRKIYSQELIGGHYDPEQADKIIEIFDRKIARVCFIPETKFNGSSGDILKRRKLLNIFTFILRSDWTNPNLIRLLEVIFNRVFCTTGSLTAFAQHMKNLKLVLRDYRQSGLLN
jgi:hypothetical protein